MLPSVVPSRAPSDPRRTFLSSVGVGLLAAGIVFTAVAAAPQAALAADDSAVTVRAADYDPDVADAPFPDLSVTVSQTKDLLLQGIQLTWTGGKQSAAPNNQTGGANFLQVMQCGGDDPQDPSRPDRTTCIYGGINTAGSTRADARTPGSVAPEDLPYSTTETFPLTAIPFRSATGDLLEVVKDGTQVPGIDLSNNQFYTRFTTNEVPWAGSGADGSGRVNFEVQTATEAPGIGCGAAEEGATEGRHCWLVIIPRGEADNGESAITKSGLFWDTWKHHVAVRLDFKPVGVRCAIGSAERQVAGSELAAVALASWQPKLCTAAGGSVYSVLTGPESDASDQANGTAPAPLALTSRALADRPDFQGVDNLRYAPIAMAGVSIAFAVDRDPSASGDVPQEVLDRSRLPFTSMKLTPRLVAKLLTDSYRDALPYSADRTHLGTNPRTITFDPDFRAVNDPEWGYQVVVAPSLADLLVPQGRFDAAHALWSYVLADPDAAAFLAGTADPWGMKVNPNAQVTGPIDTIPKADPVEAIDPSGTVGPLNLVTWRPYVNSLDQGAYLTLRGDGQVVGGWDPQATPPKYTRSDRALPGQQRVLGLTDTPSAARYQVFEAQLLNPAGTFVGPSTESLTAAAAAMTASAKQPQVYGIDFASTAAKGAPGAYPLTMPVYAALNPAVTDDALRASYAALIAYAIGDGQQPGTAIGELPAGYAPLPDGWRLQAAAAAVAIAAGDTTIPSASGSGSDDFGFGSGTGGGFSGDPVADVTNPTATGDVAGALSGGATPEDPELSGVQAAVPASLLAGLAGMFAVPVIGRIRRRIR